MQAAITLKAVAFVLSVKWQHSTLNTTPWPWKWFKMQEHVSDSQASKIVFQVRGGNAQFGNRYKNRYEFKYDYCQHCKTFGIHIKLVESNVIFECLMVATLRRELKISNYMATQ